MDRSVCIIDGNDRNDKGIIQSIQGLRGYASLCIFISHCNYLINENGENCFRWLGGLGVSVFIMISGFLLMYHYFDNHAPDSLSLFKNCLKKFYLLHIITLIAAIPFNLSILFGGGMESLKYGIAFVLNLMLLQAWIPYESVYFSYNGVTWYLSMFIFLVLISPLVLKLLKRVKKDKLVTVLFLMVLCQICWCIWMQNYTCAHWLIYIFPLIRVIDYVEGGCIYLLHRYFCVWGETVRKLG